MVDTLGSCTVKVPFVAPLATVTEDGTVIATDGVPLDSATEVALAGAAESVTVQVLDAGPVTEFGLQANADSVITGQSAMFALWVELFRVATTVAVVLVETLGN